ncbi:hypothetical protein [Rosistilla oblonga]|uniref:hypothetical protein n=1 Tax=Rosistilla oblonga TaxID=2527990 RepID=UPI003A96AF21
MPVSSVANGDAKTFRWAEPLERLSAMSLQELENTIAKLPPDEFAKFREWFLDFDSSQFDKRIETDARDGRLDSLADAALRDHTTGKSTPL